MVVLCICNVKSFVLWDVAVETKGYCLFWKAAFLNCRQQNRLVVEVYKRLSLLCYVIFK